MGEHNIDCQMLLLTGVEHSFTNKDAAAIGMAGLKYDARAERRSWAAMKDLFDEAFAG
jgi:dienelactone hydrolase